ncbi:MAG: IS5 family transposase [Methylococcales bacterium]
MQQLSFADLEYNAKKRQTRREIFLSEMERVVPWSCLLGVMEPDYPTTGRRGRPPMGLDVMLRIYLMPQWFNCSDRQMEDSLYEIESMRRFAGFHSVTEALPDETTILKFRHLLERHQLTEKLLEVVNEHPQAPGLLMSKGTMVDATIICLRRVRPRMPKVSVHPEMHPTKKGNQWYFGMKIHVGADVDSGAVHSVTVTAANTADIQELPHLLRTEDQVIFGDAGYASDEYKRGSRELGLHWEVQDKAKPGKRLSASQKKRNRKRSRVRARVEHVFRVIKRQFGYVKTRYKGLKKNAAQVYILVGLANLYLLRGRLMAA